MQLSLRYCEDIAIGESCCVVSDEKSASESLKVISPTMPVLLSTYAPDLDIMAKIFGIDWRDNNIAHIMYQILLMPVPMGTSVEFIHCLANQFVTDEKLCKYNPSLAEFYKYCFGFVRDADLAFDVESDRLLRNDNLNKAALNELYHHNCEICDTYSLCRGRIGNELRTLLNVCDGLLSYTSNNLCGLIELQKDDRRVRIGNTVVDNKICCNSLLPCKGCYTYGGEIGGDFCSACSRLFRNRLFQSAEIECALEELAILLRRRDIINKVPQYGDMRFMVMCATGLDPINSMPVCGVSNSPIPMENCRWASNAVRKECCSG